MWAGAVIWPPVPTWAEVWSMISMSRSVAAKVAPSLSADSSTLDRIGMVLRRSTTLCTWPSALISADRSMVSFIAYSGPGRRGLSPAQVEGRRD